MTEIKTSLITRFVCCKSGKLILLLTVYFIKSEIPEYTPPGVFQDVENQENV